MTPTDKTHIGDQELLEMSRLRHNRGFQLLLEGIEALLDTQLQTLERPGAVSNEIVLRQLAEWKAGRAIYTHLKQTPEIFGSNLAHFGSPAAMVQARKEMETSTEDVDVADWLQKLNSYGVE